MSRHLLALALLLAAIVSARHAQADDVVDEPYPAQHHFVVRAAGGPAYRRIYDIEVGVGVLEVGAGVDTKNGSFTGGLFGAFGETEEGIGTRHLGLQGQAEWSVVERIRVGFGPRIGWMVLDKLTESDASKSLTFGLAGEVGVDVVRASGFAVALGVAPEIHVLPGGDFDIWSDHDVTAVPSIGAFLQLRKRFARAPAPGPTSPPPR